MKDILKQIEKIHFIGIGGIGMSAVARMMLGEGKKVSGSDSSNSEITDELSKLGAKIFIGQSANNIEKDISLVIYTIAVRDDNPELVEAKKLGIKTLTYPESLNLISKEKFTIAVSGTHGKTTTTAMIAKIMIDAGLDPTVIVGSLLKEQRSNFISGESKYFVVEACEYRRSFLNLVPKILVITNIDNDHLDYYKDIKDIQSGFKEFVSKLGQDDFLVCSPSDNNIEEVVESATCSVFDYSSVEDEVKLKFPGEHNLKDARAALVVAGILGIKKEKALKSLENFSGTWRRFEYKGENKKGVIFYDDYGHHPTEIEATLSGARENFPKNKIIAVFQPHLYSRTKLLLSQFAKCFKDANEVLLAPIYAAREKNDPTISSEILAKEISKNVLLAKSFDNFKEIEEYILKNTKKEDVVITIGAGDIYKVGENLLNNDVV